MSRSYIYLPNQGKNGGGWTEKKELKKRLYGMMIGNWVN